MLNACCASRAVVRARTRGAFLMSGRSGIRALCVAALACGVLLGGPQSASADLRLAVFGAGFPFATVGQSGVDLIAITNLSLNSDSHGTQPGDPLTVTSIVLVASCGVPFTAVCPIGFRDPGVFRLRPTALGRSGTQCAGVVFQVLSVDPAEGRLQFVAPGPIVLPAGQGCTLDFTFDVLRAPAVDSRPDDYPGLQTAGILDVT